MTTHVKISAHCATTKKVQISIQNGDTGETIYLEDGESHELSVWDDKQVTVKEILSSDSI